MVFINIFINKVDNLISRMIKKDNISYNNIFLGMLVPALFILISGISSSQIYGQEDSSNTSMNNQITLTAEILDNEYVWIDGTGLVNPTLNISSIIQSEIIVNSLENDSEEHELIIEEISNDGDRNEIIESDEIEKGSSDKVKFQLNPDYEKLEYYCEYHPETMRGNINLVN